MGLEPHSKPNILWEGDDLPQPEKVAAQVVSDSIRVAAHAAIPVLSFAAAPEAHVGTGLDCGDLCRVPCKKTMDGQDIFT